MVNGKRNNPQNCYISEEGGAVYLVLLEDHWTASSKADVEFRHTVLIWNKNKVTLGLKRP